MHQRQIKGYGWKPQLPDYRDYKLDPAKLGIDTLPAKVDLRPQDVQIYDQGRLGSCTSFGVGSAFEYEMKRQGLSAFTISHLMLYYEERSIEGTVGSDSGAYIRDGIKVVANKGVCPETDWPYDISKFTQKPPDKCYQDATGHTALQYYAVQQDLDHMKAALAAGYQIVFGFTVYSSFQSSAVAQSGVVPMPQSGDQVEGGHCTRVVGYDDSVQRFICANQWGKNWGDKGYFYMPYPYLTSSSLSSDFWVISVVSGSAPTPPTPPTPPAPPTPPSPTPVKPGYPELHLGVTSDSHQWGYVTEPNKWLKGKPGAIYKGDPNGWVYLA